MKWIEYTDLDIGVRCKDADAVIVTIAGGVVQQETDANAAVGCLQQFVDQRASGQPVMDDVVLDIKADLCRADHLGARGEGFGALGQQAKARVAVCVLGGELLDTPTEG